MPRARAQSSLDDKKPLGDGRIKVDMQMSTNPSVSKDGLSAVQANRELDMWLKRELGRLHGNVLHEPVPERLLRIIEDLASPRD